MSVKGLASPQLLAHNEAVIFTDHLSQYAYWGQEERRRVEGREGEGEKGKKKKKKKQERKMNVSLPRGSADVCA